MTPRKNTVKVKVKVNKITLPQSESIIRNTSELYSASLCLELNTKVDIKAEKGFFGNPD